jgi:gliding motility-associated-like protein
MKMRISPRIISFLAFLLIGLVASSQNIIPTKGKKFWLSYLENYETATALNVFIASDNNTTGTIEMEGQGWSENFTVTANQITTIDLPASAMCQGNQQVFENGVYIETEDTVAVFAINFIEYSSDASKILPIQSLGTEYRISSYQGLNGLGSEFLILATEDDTEIEIIPSDPLPNGEPAGVPFVITLNKGQAYQVTTESSTIDYTGTLIRGTEESGDCRPFAVFAGTKCVNIPVGCTACDHIFDQHFPVETWGTEFYTVPFDLTTGYTIRIMAHQDNTVVNTALGTLNLNAGEFQEYNNVNEAHCITSNQGISVTQYMQGVTCSAAGDPAMSVLNDAAQMIDNISFSTVESNIITNHGLNLIVNTADVGSVSLDGTPIPASEFTEYPDCTEKSYAQISIAEGVHNLESVNGVTAYVFGTGDAESYFYSVGSFSSDPIEIENVTCSNDTITLAVEGDLINVEWYAQTDPETIVGTGPNLVLVPPIISDIYVAVGDQFQSGCSAEEYFSVEVPDPPALETWQSAEEVCQYQSVQLGVDVDPFSGAYNYEWTPAAGLDDPTSPTPIATPLTTTTYQVYVYTNSGCGSNTAELTVEVIEGDLPTFNILSDDTGICEGEHTSMSIDIEGELMEDDFDPGSDPSVWADIQNGSASVSCGSETGNALWFNGNGQRYAQTVPMDVSMGGTVTISIRIGSGAFPCENADVGEDVVLEYNSTGTWQVMETYGQGAYTSFTTVSTEIPPAAQSTNTSFRWRQLANSGDMEDNWSIDNFYVSQNLPVTGYTWSPDYNISSLTDSTVTITPTIDTTYFVDYLDPNTGCTYTDSLEIIVDESFVLTLPNDTSLCDVGGVELNAQPDVPGNYTFEWTGAGLSSYFSQTPVATPNVTTTYSVVVTSANGCSIEDEVTVEVFSLLDLEISASQDVICFGEESQIFSFITGSTGDETITWEPSEGLSDPDSFNPIASPDVTTNYILTISSSDNVCSIVDSVEIEVIPEIVVDAGDDATVCDLNGYQLNATTDFPDPLDWQWSNPGNLSNANIPNPIVTSNQSITFEVFVTDDNGCTSSDEIELSLFFDVIDLGPDTEFCDGDTIQLGETLEEGLTYAWSTSENSQIIDVYQPGLYSVLVSSDEGCEFEDAIQVTMNPLPVIDFGQIGILCEGDVQTLNAGNPGSTYAWSTNQVSQSISVTESDNYSVSVTNGFGCISEAEVDLTFNANPVVDLDPLYRICEGEAAFLDVFNPSSIYQWSNGESSSTISVSESDDLSVTVTNQFGCTTSGSTSVVVEPTPYISIGEDRNLCIGDIAELSVDQEQYTYSWSTGSTETSIKVMTPGVYEVTAFTEYCSFTDQVMLTFEQPPRDFLPDEKIFCFDNCPYDLILNAGNENVTYLWDDGSTEKELVVKEPGIYTVRMSTPAGCLREYSTEVIEICKGNNVFIPNAFTPDGDGINDVFKVSAPEGIEDFKLRIFNRFGELVFITTDPDEGWNGGMHDSEYYVQTEMYVYTIRYTYYKNCEGTEVDVYEGEGQITMIR